MLMKNRLSFLRLMIDEVVVHTDPRETEVIPNDEQRRKREGVKDVYRDGGFF